MKKLYKITSLLLACIVLVGTFCGCGIIRNNDANKNATVVDNEGVESQMTAASLRATYRENEARYIKLYKDADITLIGTVQSVDTSKKLLHISGRLFSEDVYLISTDEDWHITVIADDHPEVIDLRKGDKIKVKTKITDDVLFYIDLMHIVTSTDNRKLKDKTTIKIVEQGEQ